MRSYITLQHNPTTITAPTYGVFGLVGTTWTVVNESKVGYYGIQLSSGGTVINNKSASILAVYNPTFPRAAGVLIRGGSGNVANAGILAGYWGVLLYGGGYVLNYGAKALIEGSSQRPGIEILGSAGTVANSGTITGVTGVYLDTKTGRVTNYGEISGTYYGVFLKGGGAVVNGGTRAKGALISGRDASSSHTYASGIEIKGGPGSVANFGTITGDSGSITVELGAGGTVVNGSADATRASISGADTEIIIGGGRGTVTNFATISGDNIKSVGIELQNGGTVVNGSADATRALISMTYTGVTISGGHGAVTNFATINGSYCGVDLQNGGKVVNGAISAPRALIETTNVGGYAVKIDGGPASVTNFGTIAAPAHRSDKYGGGVRIANTTGTVTNFGNIDSVHLKAGGIIVNGSREATSASIGSASIYGTAGTVTNLGTMGGVDLSDGGSVTNGSVTAKTALITLVDVDSQAGTVMNFGTIADETDGLYLSEGGAITNFGVIRGETGVQTGGATTLTNSGTIVGTGGTAVRLGGGDDMLTVKAGAAFAGRVRGGGGTDKVVQGSAGALGVIGFSGFETFFLANGGADRLTLTNGNFAGVTGASITVEGGSRGNTVNASAVTGKNRVIVVGGAGKDGFIGGGGEDIFRFSAADLAATDIVKGGAGKDQLKLTSAGTVRAKGVGGVETYVLFNGAGNVLSLANANFAGVTGSTITVDGGNAGNTLGETGVSATDKAVLNGGAGPDTLIAGRNAVLKGGTGKDVFELTVPGTPSAPVSVTIADFAHGVDKIAFSEKGFDLGSAPVAATLFGANKTGSFTSPDQRFAYDTTHGQLFYDAHGNAAHSSQELIASLTHSPTLTAGDVTFLA